MKNFEKNILRWKALIFLLLIAVLGSASESWAGTVLSQGKFTAMTPGWGAADMYCTIKDGKMTVQPNAKETYTAIYEGNIFSNDMDASINIKVVKAPDPTWTPACFSGAVAGKIFIGLVINANGWFRI
uniref:Uncharacterized protein n=1 Tax=Desulfobacca acetoxidans TaxID=60893 RepID=A0A7V6A4C6_9BACT